MKITSSKYNNFTQITVYIPYSELKSDTQSGLIREEEKPVRITKTYKKVFPKKGHELIEVVLKELIEGYDSYFLLYKRIGIEHVYNELKLTLKSLDDYQENLLKEVVEIACSAIFNEKTEVDVDTLRTKYNLDQNHDLLVSLLGTFGYGKTTLIKKVLGFDDSYSFLLVDNGRTTISNSIARGMIVDKNGYIHNYCTDENGDKEIPSELIHYEQYKYKNCIYLENPEDIYNNVIIPHLEDSFELCCSLCPDGINTDKDKAKIIKKFITDTKCNLDGLFGDFTFEKNDTYYNDIINRFDEILKQNNFETENFKYAFSNDEILKNSFLSIYDNYTKKAIDIINEELKLNEPITYKPNEPIKFELSYDQIGETSENCYKLFTSNRIKGGGIRILVKEIYTEVNLEPKYYENLDSDSENYVTPSNLYSYDSNNSELKYTSIVFADTVGCSHVQGTTKSSSKQDIIGKSALLHESDIILLIDKATETMVDSIKEQLRALENLGCKDKIILCYSYYNQFVKKDMKSDADREAILSKLLNEALNSLYPERPDKAKRFYKLLSDNNNQHVVYLKGLVKRLDLKSQQDSEPKTNKHGRRSITNDNQKSDDDIAKELNKDFQHSEKCLSELIEKMISTSETIKMKERHRFSINNISSNDEYTLNFPEMYDEFTNTYLSLQKEVYKNFIPAWNTSKALCYNAKNGNAYYEGSSIILAPFNDALYHNTDSLSKFLDKFPPIEIGIDEEGYNYDQALNLDFLIDRIKAIYSNDVKEYFNDILVLGKKHIWAQLESLCGTGVKKLRSDRIYETIENTFLLDSIKPKIHEILKKAIKSVIEEYGTGQ